AVRSPLAGWSVLVGRDRLGQAQRNAECGRRNAEQKVRSDSHDAGGAVPAGAGSGLAVPQRPVRSLGAATLALRAGAAGNARRARSIVLWRSRQCDRPVAQVGRTRAWGAAGVG